MNKENLLKTPGQVFPQTVEIPAPLEIHPSVDPELARGLIAAVEYIDQHPEEFDMTNPRFEDGKDCVICHAERLSNWKRPADGSGFIFLTKSAIGHWSRIFFHLNWGGLNPKWNDGYNSSELRLERIEHFLRTGE